MNEKAMDEMFENIDTDKIFKKVVFIGIIIMVAITSFWIGQDLKEINECVEFCDKNYQCISDNQSWSLNNCTKIELDIDFTEGYLND